MILRRLLIVAIAGAVCGCSRPATRQLEVVKIATRGYLTVAPIYIAEEDGYFADAGIKLEFSEPPRSNAQMIPLLERGSFDVMASQLSAAFFAAVAQGGKSRIVADRGHVEANGCNYEGVMMRRGLFDKAAPTAATLKGIRFSLSPAGAGAYVTDKYFASLGLSIKDLDLVRLGETVEPQALEAGSIDGLHVVEPYLSKLVSEGHELVGPAGRYAPGLQNGVLIFGPSLTVKNRELGDRFMEAYLRGVKTYRQGLTDRNVEIISRRSHLAADVVRKICLPTIGENGEVNNASLVDFQKWLQSGGSLTTVLPESGTDMTFARRAAKKLGIDGPG